MGDEDKQGGARFEPPPWEREAFEALAAKRAEQEAEARTVAEALAAAAKAGESATAEQEAAPETLPTLIGAQVTPEAAEPPRPAAEPDSKVVQAMMMQLAREEYTDRRSTKVVAWVASGITVALGASMLVWGLLIASRAGGKGTAVIGSAVLSVFGLSFIGMAVWVWISTSRVRGR
jgi:VIT1/CCC1 family predicted Fe2+/Mn2+ transporter